MKGSASRSTCADACSSSKACGQSGTNSSRRSRRKRRPSALPTAIGTRTAASLIGRHSLARRAARRVALPKTCWPWPRGCAGFYLADADQFSAFARRRVVDAADRSGPRHVVADQRRQRSARRKARRSKRPEGLVATRRQTRRTRRPRRERQRRRPRREVVGDQGGLPGHDGAAADRPRSRVHTCVARHVAAGAQGADARVRPRRRICCSIDRGGGRRAIRKPGVRTSIPARCGKRRAQGRAS